ncbi:hypothetical protein QOT17_023462 [Balamuthia mandrillaris]
MEGKAWIDSKGELQKEPALDPPPPGQSLPPFRNLLQRYKHLPKYEVPAGSPPGEAYAVGSSDKTFFVHVKSESWGDTWAESVTLHYDGHVLSYYHSYDVRGEPCPTSKHSYYFVDPSTGQKTEGDAGEGSARIIDLIVADSGLEDKAAAKEELLRVVPTGLFL